MAEDRIEDRKADRTSGAARRPRRLRWLVLALLAGGAAWAARNRWQEFVDESAPPAPHPPQLPDAGDAGREVCGTARLQMERLRQAGEADPDRSEAPAERVPADRAAAAQAVAEPAVADAIAAELPTTEIPVVADPDGSHSAPRPAPRPSPRPRRSAVAELPAGSAQALPDGSAPGPEYTVKAKSGSELFHGPDSPYFGRTRAEFWFRTAEDARTAGFTEWTPRSKRSD